jgi:hypothetical protein
MPRKQPAQTKASKRRRKPGEAAAEHVTPRLLTLRAAAAYLALTPWGLREKVWAGLVPVVRWRDGGKLYFDKTDLDQLIAKHKRVIQ